MYCLNKTCFPWSSPLWFYDFVVVNALGHIHVLLCHCGDAKIMLILFLICWSFSTLGVSWAHILLSHEPYTGVSKYTSYNKTILLMTGRACCIKTIHIYIHTYKTHVMNRAWTLFIGISITLFQNARCTWLWSDIFLTSPLAMCWQLEGFYFKFTSQLFSSTDEPL